MDSSPDPVDHSRTTRQHAGESVKNGANAPGMVAVAVAIVALVAGLFGLASGHTGAGVVGVVVAVVLGAAGLGWLALAHRRVRAAERRWLAEHPEAPIQPPTS